LLGFRDAIEGATKTGAGFSPLALEFIRGRVRVPSSRKRVPASPGREAKLIFVSRYSWRDTEFIYRDVHSPGRLSDAKTKEESGREGKKKSRSKRRMCSGDKNGPSVSAARADALLIPREEREESVLSRCGVARCSR